MSNNLLLRTSTHVSPAQSAQAVAALTLAFASDPVVRWCWPEAATYLRTFPDFVYAFGGRSFARESAFTVVGMGGAALWLPPGEQPDEAALVALLERSLHEAQRPEAYSLLEAMGQYHPERPHWYLPLIGVEPYLQSRGLGHAMMEPALRRCDESRTLAYLESTNPRNIPFYQRLGFREAGRISVGSCPVVVPMVREPAQ